VKSNTKQKIGKAESDHQAQFPIVGVGASAGGLEAFSELLAALPADTGMAFVLVSHLSPNHQSMLSEILGRRTRLPVLEVSDEPEVLPNHVYVIPPNRNMTLKDGHLTLAPRVKTSSANHPIDRFFQSLADTRGHLSIGVVLSGSATDGTIGLSAIKSAGGITFAQDESAAVPSMPRSAIAAECVDLVLSPKEIAGELAEIASHPYVAPKEREEDLEKRSTANLERIMQILHRVAGVDFAHYKKTTLLRRVNRRMALNKLQDLSDYAKVLEKDKREVGALFHDILINVTSFFRDPDAFEALKAKVFPKMLQDRNRKEPIRIWAVGCSTGEEAYSLAMSLCEYHQDTGKTIGIQIFATDLNGAGVEKARAGLYSKTAVEPISPERLRRFFTEEDLGYRISKEIRDMCIFAQHNVLTEAPFSRMDLISCRNLLIYLEPVMQQRVLPIFHYALKDQGHLWLGNSETIGTFRELFEIEDPKHKIFLKKRAATRMSFTLPLGSKPLEPFAKSHLQAQLKSEVETAKAADIHLLAKYSPPGVVINSDLEIIQFKGDTGDYLTPAAGRASLNLLKMLRDGLVVRLRAAIMTAKREKRSVRDSGLKVRTNEGYRNVDIEVVPLPGSSMKDPSFLITFEPAENGRVSYQEMGRFQQHRDLATLDERAKESEFERLRQELADTREYLQSVIEQQEAANEELQSANEEIQSSNEELQSINEELETSKEEIQSSNEELSTVNDELQHRNVELAQTNNDLLNLLSSVQLPILMLDQDLKIRRFTPTAERLLSLISSDVGRKIGDLKLNLLLPDIESLVSAVIESAMPREMELQDKDGRWFLLRIRPYKTLENRIDGAVIVLVDIDNLRKAHSAAKESEERFQSLADSAPVLIWVNSELGCVFANRAYHEFVGGSDAQLFGMEWTKFLHPDDRNAYLTEYSRALKTMQIFESQARFRRHDGQFRWMKSVGVPRFTDDGDFLGYVGSTYDVHDLRQARDALVDADVSKDNFLAMLAHELRNPMAPLATLADLLKTGGSINGENAEMVKDVLVHQVGNMSRMVDDLLDVARISKGKIDLKMDRLQVAEVIALAEATMRETRDFEDHTLIFHPVDPSLFVLGDKVRLEQIVNNLLNNASKFTPRGGTIEVSATRSATASGPVVNITVSDSGIGLDDKALDKVFQLFHQEKQSAGRKQGGLGIGLTLAKILAEMHGGQIHAKSFGKNHGSEFTVTLPLAEQD
jgi:two-component system CheB/CheR fusion protein